MDRSCCLYSSVTVTSLARPNRIRWAAGLAASDQARFAAVNRPSGQSLRPLGSTTQAPACIDKLDFSRLICENVGPIRPAVIMLETISKAMATTLAAIKALTDADRVRPGAMK